MLVVIDCHEQRCWGESFGHLGKGNGRRIWCLGISIDFAARWLLWEKILEIRFFLHTYIRFSVMLSVMISAVHISGNLLGNVCCFVS